VGKTYAGRALRIADALVRALIHREYRLDHSADRRARLAVLGRWCRFRVEETRHLVKNPTESRLRRARGFRRWDPQVKCSNPRAYCI
jgi:hypothetical protein